MRPCTSTAAAPQAKGSRVAWTPSKSSHQHNTNGSSYQLLSADRLIREQGPAAPLTPTRAAADFEGYRGKGSWSLPAFLPLHVPTDK